MSEPVHHAPPRVFTRGRSYDSILLVTGILPPHHCLLDPLGSRRVGRSPGPPPAWHNAAHGGLHAICC